MNQAHNEERWDHTAVLIAKLHNVHAAKGKTIKPQDVHPFRKKVTPKPIKVPFKLALSFLAGREIK